MRLFGSTGRRKGVLIVSSATVVRDRRTNKFFSLTKSPPTEAAAADPSGGEFFCVAVFRLYVYTDGGGRNNTFF